MNKLRSKVTFAYSFFLISLTSVYFRFQTLKAPIYGDYEFRQTQTAWPVKYWLDHGFTPMSPAVPVRGTNPTWLLEFPLFQWIAYFIAKLTGLNADHAVKIVAVICSLLIGLLIGLIVGKITTQAFGLLASAIYLCTPFSLWWGTAGLIDNLATLFAVAALAITIFRETFLNWRLSVAMLLGFAALIKPNVSIMYAAAVALLIVLVDKRLNLGTVSLFGASVLVPTVVWSKYSVQGIVSSDPRIIWYPTKAMYYWFFGSMDQYLALPQSLIEILARTTQATGGTLVISILVVCGLLNIERSKLVIACMGGVFLSWSIFINLNIVHSYYQIPAVPLICITAGLGLYHLLTSTKFFLSRSKIVIAMVVPMLLLFSATEPGFGNGYWVQLRNPNYKISDYANELKKNTSPESLIVFAGMSNDPTVFFESNREGYMFDDAGAMFDMEKTFLEKQDLSRYCAFAVADSANQKRSIDALKAMFPTAAKVSKHVYRWC